MIEGELTATSNLIVKKRAIEMLSKLSDFEDFQKNSELQENLLSGLIQVFKSEEGENADFCLKMTCVDYLFNFLNDANFKVQTYAHTVPVIVFQASQLLKKLLVMRRTNIINEVLQLYRLIVDNYSQMNINLEDGSGQSIIGSLILLLIEITKELGGFQGVSEHTEGNIVV